MRKLYIFSLIGLAAIIIGLAWAEQITLSTYYPAPYGVYRDFKVTRNATFATETDPATGELVGRVGIGTTGPAKKLHVIGEGSFQNLNAGEYGAIGIAGQGDGLIYSALNLMDANGIEVWGIQHRQDLNNNLEIGYFGTGVFPLSLTTSGNVGIGTTNPTRALEVYGQNLSGVGLGAVEAIRTKPDSDLGAALELWHSENAGGRNYLIISTGSTNTGGVGNFEIADFTDPANPMVRLIIRSSGNVGIGTINPSYLLQVGNAGDSSEARANAWNILSDVRLKTNLIKLTDALDRISQMNGYYFNWKTGTDKRKQVGVIAQEVEKVLPEAVSEDSEGIKSVEYGKLSPLVIEAIKELKAENDALKARIETLEAKLE